MKISIIISTWNNSSQLAKTLTEFLECADVGSVPWELVLVNNNSTDNTEEIIKQFSSKLPIKYIYEPVQGLSRARNAGIREASGDLIIFTDDDVFPSKDWINIYAQAFRRHPAGYFFGGPIKSRFEKPGISSDFLRYCPPSLKGVELGEQERILERHEYVVAANWACPKDILDKLGGFDEEKGLNPDKKTVVTGEETALIDKIRDSGIKLLYLPLAKIEHFVPEAKCKPAHIIQRWKALGYETALLDIRSYGKKQPHILPAWMYKQYVILWLNWIRKVVTGQPPYKELYHLKLFEGKMKAVGDYRI